MINVKEHEQLSILNHSAAHLLAHAVKHLYPNAKFWVGPVIEEGFYYDIDLGDEVINEDDLEQITKEMKKIVKSDKLIKRIELSKEEALEIFKDDPYKIDLIENMSTEEIISAYKQDDFIDLCRGPHVNTTKSLKHFKLLKVSGAYYKGDSKNKVLQRIYGICFENEEDLEKHLEALEDAKKKFVGPNPNILALPKTFKLSAVHLMMKDDVYTGKGAEDCHCMAHQHMHG